MNKGFFSLSILPLLAVVMVAIAPAVSADDFSDALDAYNKGQYARATDIWRDLAEQDNIEAQYALGVMYFKGEGINQNRELAVAWFQKAAGKGHLASMFNMGVSLWTGEGAAVNFDQALEWWQRAAESGYAPAQYNLGITYHAGESVTSDPALARYWLEQAAAQNYSDSADLLTRIDGSVDSNAENARLDRQIEGELDARVADSTPVISDPGGNDDLLDSLDSLDKPVAPSNTDSVQAEFVQTGSDFVKASVLDDSAVETVAVEMATEATDEALNNNPPEREILDNEAADEDTNAELAALDSIAGAAANSDGQVNQVSEINQIEATNSEPVEKVENETSTLAAAVTQEQSTETVTEPLPPAVIPGPLEQTTLIDTIRIGNQPAPVYASNNRQAPVIETLAPGTPVRVIQRKGGFSKIEAPGGFPVWVYGRYVQVDGIWAYITGDRVNARSLPSTARTAVSLGLLKKDSRVAFLEARPGWIHVRAPETFSAWIETDVTTFQNEPEDGFELAWNSARQGVIGE